MASRAWLIAANDEAAAVLFHLAAQVLDGPLAQQAAHLARWHDEAAEIDWDSLPADDSATEATEAA
jgi:hypothetical protein